MTHIYLWGNDLFASSFISNLDNLTNLQWLDIGGNQLDGADVLPKISSLTKLTGLGLHDSGLTDDDLQDYMADLKLSTLSSSTSAATTCPTHRHWLACPA